ncbi:iron complex transport system ATP-binding protein [Roseivivax marinus]|nr:iron complex transport system ATP-binding protein [Roseivivax marinus]
MMLSCESLGWSVRGRPIVEGVSLRVEEGETLGLIGPNGSGKSTLLKMLAGIRPPTAGRVVLGAHGLETVSQRQIAPVIALVEQQADTGDRISVRDAIELGRTPWLSVLRPWSEADSQIVADALAAVGMTGFADRPWHTLSGGERRVLTSCARSRRSRESCCWTSRPTTSTSTTSCRSSRLCAGCRRRPLWHCTISTRPWSATGSR